MPTYVPLLPVPIQLADSTTSLNMSAGSLEFFLSGTATATNLFSDNAGTSIGSTITLNSGGYPESGGNIITLFRDSSIALKIVCKDAAGGTIWTSDALQDALVLLASVANAKGASLVGVEDSGGYFAGAEAETILADIGLNYAKKTAAANISAVWTWTGGSIAMTDKAISRPKLTDYSIGHAVITQTDSTPDFDIATGAANSFVVTLTENATFALSNPSPTGTFCQISIKIIQGASAYTVAWPSGVKWPSGSAPTISVGNGAVDQVTLWTIDAGTTWYGNYSQAFA